MCRLSCPNDHTSPTGKFSLPYPRATEILAGSLWKKAAPPASSEPANAEGHHARLHRDTRAAAPVMSRTPDTPKLTPQFCFDQTALRDFLRVSRGAVDDTISQNLNALVTPGAQPFDPSVTTTRQPRPIGRRAIDAESCNQFKEKVLFPSWQTRSDVLNYCAGVATSPDPNDPQHVLREVEDVRARERVVDQRLDPYSARYFPRTTRTESLAALIRNERMVENIIRSRTWGLVGERCDNEGMDAEWAVDEWRKRQSGGEER